MKIVLNVVGVLLFLTGAVWLFQGIGVIQGSVMTNDRQWALIGIVCIVIGIGLLVNTYRRYRSPVQN